jgi:hypothetical protein
VQKLISWKHSFRRLNEEYEVARKKKQALDNLLTKGRISQSTHDMFNKEIDGAIADIEKQQKALLEKMAAKVVELEGQVMTLEVLLANFEIRHVTGEIDDEVYQRESDIFFIGLETAKQELDEVKEAADQLASGELPFDREVGQQPEEKEVTQTEVKFLGEGASTDKKETAEHHEETVVEAITCTEETEPIKVEAKVEEKQEA